MGWRPSHPILSCPGCNSPLGLMSPKLHTPASQQLLSSHLGYMISLLLNSAITYQTDCQGTQCLCSNNLHFACEQHPPPLQHQPVRLMTLIAREAEKVEVVNRTDRNHMSGMLWPVAITPFFPPMRQQGEMVCLYPSVKAESLTLGHCYWTPASLCFSILPLIQGHWGATGHVVVMPHWLPLLGDSSYKAFAVFMILIAWGVPARHLVECL